MSRKDKIRYQNNQYKVTEADVAEETPEVEEIVETPVEESAPEETVAEEETVEPEAAEEVQPVETVVESLPAVTVVENQPAIAVEYDWDRPVEKGMFAELLAANLPADQEKEIVLKLAAKGLAFQTIITENSRIDNESIIVYSINPEATYKQYISWKEYLKTK